MKFSSKALAVLASSVGLVSVNFAIPLPAKAAVTCESGTISNHQNGSLAFCILGQDTTLQISSPTSGVATFECKDKNLISFDDKGQFTGCQLAEELKLLKNNSVETCPAEYRVSVSSSTDGTLSISCNH